MSKMLRLDPEKDRALIERIKSQNDKALASLIAGPENASPVQTGLRNMQALGRMKPGKLNKTELAFQEELELKKQTGRCLWYRSHPFNLRLADNTYYRPDFAAMDAAGLIDVYDVKGWWTDDALVKIKVAAEQFPFRFIAVSKAAKKDGGHWTYKYF